MTNEIIKTLEIKIAKLNSDILDFSANGEHLRKRKAMDERRELNRELEALKK